MNRKWAYVAFDRGGKSVPGVIEAPGESEAREMLRHKSLFVTQIKESLDGATAKASSTRGGAAHKRVGRGRVLKNLTTFTRQLHVLLASGTPLVQSLGALERQSKDLSFRAVVADVRALVEEGVAL